jgi:hypothetical protein
MSINKPTASYSEPTKKPKCPKQAKALPHNVTCEEFTMPKPECVAGVCTAHGPVDSGKCGDNKFGNALKDLPPIGTAQRPHASWVITVKMFVEFSRNNRQQWEVDKVEMTLLELAAHLQKAFISVAKHLYNTRFGAQCEKIQRLERRSTTGHDHVDFGAQITFHKQDQLNSSTGAHVNHYVNVSLFT